MKLDRSVRVLLAELAHQYYNYLGKLVLALANRRRLGKAGLSERKNTAAQSAILKRSEQSQNFGEGGSRRAEGSRACQGGETR